MKIIDYFRSLLPSFEKSRITEDARVTYSSVENSSIPTYKEAEKVFTSFVFRSKKIKDLVPVFNRITESPAKNNIVLSISRFLSKLLDHQSIVREKIESVFEDAVITEGMGCLKGNLIRILEVTAFLSDYATRFLNYIYIHETAEAKGDESYVKDNIVPAEEQYIQENFVLFCTFMKYMSIDKEKLKRTLDNMPDVLLNANNANVIGGTFGEAKLDPLLICGFGASIGNPIYMIRLNIAEMQVGRYKQRQELKKVLELRLLNLNMQLEQNPSAQLEREIEVTQGRVDKLTYALKKTEEGVS
jgi:hypothetical protein